MRNGFLASVVVLAFSSAAPIRAADEYAVDGVHSSISFKVSHIGLSWIHGRFNEFSGTILIDPNDASKCSFALAIKPESVDTNNQKRDEHLRAPDYFNVKQFPVFAFKSTAVTAGKDGYQVTGNLTLHGVTKPVSFALMGGRKAEFPKGVQRIGFTTELTLKRSEFGMDKALDAIGDDVHIAISLSSTKKQSGAFLVLDPMRILVALAAAAVTAAAVFLLCSWPWRFVRPGRGSIGGVVGVAAGFFLGCWLLGARPHWPAREDQDRLLLWLFPALIAVELIAIISGQSRRVAWPLRLGIAAVAARILLHDTIFLTDLGVPGTPQWSPGETWLILGGLALALAANWMSLVSLARRCPGCTVPLAVSLACAGAALTVMLSGYASGGLLGLALAAALAGATLAALPCASLPEVDGILGLGIVGLFALVVSGHWFGNLAPGNALLLFFAPVLCWLPELPPRFRGVVRLLWVAVPVTVALALAQQQFAVDFSRGSSSAKEPPGQVSPDAQEPTDQDYLDFKK